MANQQTDPSEAEAEAEFTAAEAQGDWLEWDGSGPRPWRDAAARYVCKIALARGMGAAQVRELSRSVFETRLRSYEAAHSVLLRYSGPDFVKYCEARFRQEVARGFLQSASVVDSEAKAGEASSAQPEATVVLDVTNRRAEVDRFLRKCNLESRSEVRREHIWRAVGHKHPRQFGYWQAGQDRLPGTIHGATKADDQNFRRILAMDPARFVALLKKYNIAYVKSRNPSTRRTSTPILLAPRRKMSAAGRKRIAAATRKRWAEWRKKKKAAGKK